MLGGKRHGKGTWLHIQTGRIRLMRHSDENLTDMMPRLHAFDCSTNFGRRETARLSHGGDVSRIHVPLHVVFQ